MIRYAFRPNLFRRERTIVLDAAGMTVRDGDGPARRVAWTAIEEVHIEPATAGEDGHARWLINLRAKGAAPVQIDSVNVRGTQDFEHKTEEFLAVLRAIHAALAPRAPEVRFRFGMRAGIVTLWRFALILALAAGLLGTVAAIATGEWEAVFGALAFVGIGVSGLALLRGRRGPRPYDPSGFAEPAEEARATGE